ncbi:AAA family ATPase [Desulfotruncus alcoholivorax]|uniref:AAA family ATPase n=1 Tax=Desulfotruncus alcoholivorax TaxID=265477 RepID=UPI00040C520D|nr:AAA family ATPase [Desulfotruncus alcoholivorax]
MKVLICDPDETRLNNLAQALPEYDVITATSGKDCFSTGPVTVAFISSNIQDIMWDNLVAVLAQQGVLVYLTGPTELELLQALLEAGGKGIIAPEAAEMEKILKRLDNAVVSINSKEPQQLKKRPLRGRLDRTAIRTARPAAVEELAPVAPVNQVSSISRKSDTLFHNSKLVVFYAFKGGVGKSLLSASTAVALANNRVKKLSVCIVDFDPYNGDIAKIFNIQQNSCSILDWLAKDGEDLKDYLVDHPSGVKILPGPCNPLDGLAIGIDEAKRILSVLTRRFDVVVVDTTHIPRDSVIVAMENASHVFMLGTPDRITLKDDANIGQTLRNAQVDISGFFLLINRMPKKAPLRLSDYVEHLPWDIKMIIPEDYAVSRIINAGNLPVLDRRTRLFNQSVAQLVNIIEPVHVEQRKFALPFLRRRAVN